MQAGAAPKEPQRRCPGTTSKRAYSRVGIRSPYVLPSSRGASRTTTNAGRVADLRQLALRCWTTVWPGQARSMPQILGRRLPRHYFALYAEERQVINLPAYTGRAVLLHELAHAIRLARYRGESPLCSHDAVFARICLDLWIGAGLVADVPATLFFAYACGVRITPRLEVEEQMPGLSHWRKRPGLPTPPSLDEDKGFIELLIDKEFNDEDQWRAWCEGAIAAYN